MPLTPVSCRMHLEEGEKTADIKGVRIGAGPFNIRRFVLAGVFLGLGLGGLAFLPRAIAWTASAPEKAFAASAERLTRIEDALEILKRVPSGSELLARAEGQWPQGLLSSFRWGEASKTDAVITRYYNAGTGEERRERKVSVILRKEQPLEELVLDLAHELVHATARPAWDPYDPELTPARYIRNAIEGPGGEVEAVISECAVSLELAERFGTSAERCERYLSNGKILREKVLQEFYRIGSWRKELQAKLAAETALLPLLSAERPRLFSSTGHTPYPVALFQEYEELTRIACRNSRRRIDLGPGGKATGRHSAQRLLASDPALAFLRTRCRK